jgi:hypothetical protein
MKLSLLRGGSVLKDKIYSTFDPAENAESLPRLCLDLLAEQKKTWSALQDAYKAHEKVKERDIFCRNFSVLLQHNPGRAGSTLAPVGEPDISRPQCFLCVENLPERQKGILYRDEYLILCNPAPVFPAHFTIARISHRPQVISQHVALLIRLMTDFGSGWMILYNGAKCGASAPDHFHFQAVPSGRMPIEKELQAGTMAPLIVRAQGFALYRIEDAGREAVVLDAESPQALAGAFIDFLEALKEVLLIEEEPMINGIALITGAGATACQKKTWRLIVFPRRKHRPDAFFRHGDARIAVSPAVIEMGGVLVTPFARDFERLDAAAVEAIYEEVSLKKEIVQQAVDALKSDLHRGNG